jgi:hypothetical protein
VKLHVLGIALLAACAAALAQTQSGSSIGANSPGIGGNVQPRPLPPTLPSTGTSADSAGAQGTSPPTPETSVGTSGATAAPLPDRSSGRCDTLTGQERTQCLREQASTGTTGAGSVGGSPGGLK